MAEQADSTLRTCKHCQKEKPLSAFVRMKGGTGYKHKCRECRSAQRRAAYAKRTGEYAQWDEADSRAKRAEYHKQRRGKFEWDESWLNWQPVKTCGHCHIELPANPAWFVKDSRDRSGLSSWCRACAAREYDKNKAKRLESQRLYWRKKWEADAARLKAERVARRKRDVERARVVNRRWYAENIERERARSVADSNAYRARKISAPGAFTIDDINAMKAAQKGRCWYCSKKLTKFHVDHRVPLARGGSNDPSNLVLACPPCNLSKGAKMPWELDTPRLL